MEKMSSPFICHRWVRYEVGIVKTGWECGHTLYLKDIVEAMEAIEKPLIYKIIEDVSNQK